MMNPQMMGQRPGMMKYVSRALFLHRRPNASRSLSSPRADPFDSFLFPSSPSPSPLPPPFPLPFPFFPSLPRSGAINPSFQNPQIAGGGVFNPLAGAVSPLGAAGGARPPQQQQMMNPQMMGMGMGMGGMGGMGMMNPQMMGMMGMGGMGGMGGGMGQRPMMGK